MRKAHILGAAMVLAAGLAQGAAQAGERVDLVLNWVAGSDHAPIYWAQKLGWYEQAGVDLVIEEGRGSGASVKKVGVGASGLGIADLPTALQGRGKGADVVAVMAIYANNPYGLYWRKDSGIATVQDLKGRKIGNPPFDAARQMWPAIAKAIGIPADSVEWVNIAPDAKVQSLKAGVIDVTTHFYNAHFLYERLFGDELGFLALRDVGFNPYGNAIIANGAWLKEHQAAAEAFVQVTQKAFAECYAKTRECIETFSAMVSQKPEDIMASWEQVVVLMDHPAFRDHAIGYFDPARLKTDYQYVAESFEIEAFDVTSAYTNDLLDMSVKLKLDR